ncbi:hypothetical protein JXA32_08220 [Candidatus Sumerlaeota bacterium]|nr:hypothetical protein [Candidatus Sumerlaeota bacterium]
MKHLMLLAVCWALICGKADAQTNVYDTAQDAYDSIASMLGSWTAGTYISEGFMISTNPDIDYYISVTQNGDVYIDYYNTSTETSDSIVHGVPISELSSILSALRSGLGLAAVSSGVDEEDLEAAIETAAQVVTSTALTDAPAGPMDSVFSELGLGGGLAGRLNVRMDDGSAHTGTEGAIGATNAAAIAAARYTRFDAHGVDGNIYGITLGYERETDNSRYGIIIPYDRIDYDGTAADADSFTFVPYYQYIPMRDPVKVATGPYLIYNYTFIHDMDNASFRGVGVNASVEKFFNAFWVRGAVAGEFLDSDVNRVEDDCVFRLRTGGIIGVPLSDKTEVRGYVMHTLADAPFLGGDDNFFTLGTELSQQLSDGFSLAIGFLTPAGHRHLTSYTGYIGGTMAIR